MVPVDWPHVANDRDICKTEAGVMTVCEFGCIGCVVPHFRNLALRVLALEDQVMALNAKSLATTPTEATNQDAHPTSASEVHKSKPTNQPAHRTSEGEVDKSVVSNPEAAERGNDGA